MLMGGLILANYISLVFTIRLMNKKIQSSELSGVALDTELHEKGLLNTLLDPNIYCLLICTLLVVGTGTTFQLESPTVAFAMNSPQTGPHVMKLYWISDASARLVGGLAAAVLSRIVSRYLFLAILSF